MAKIIGAISMSHAPGASGWPDAPEIGMRQRVQAIHEQLAEYLDECKPDLIVAFLDDHFENHYRNLMPTFSIGIAPTHSGPPEYMLKGVGMDEVKTISSDEELGEHMLTELVHSGFDFARMGELEYGNNLMTPLMLIRPQCDIPVLPIYTNVFSPPLCTTKRAYDMGAAVAQSLESYPKNLRVCLLATGGLSHWPPVWTSNSPEDDEFLARMKRYQTEGKSYLEHDPDIYTDLCEYEVRMAAANQYPLNSSHPLVNEEWDKMVLDLIGAGDKEKLFAMTYEEIEKHGGHGGHELLNWMAVMGAMGGKPSNILGYEAVIEWICGMAYVTYDV